MQTEFSQDFAKIGLSTPKTFKDKFKPLFCGKDFYQIHQNDFKTLRLMLEPINDKYKVILWTVMLCCLRRKNDWYAGVLMNPRTSLFSAEQTLEQSIAQISVCQIFKALNICWPKALDNEIPFNIFLSVIKIKAIPESALSGIYGYLNGRYNLEILCYEPIPLEVLKLQIQNKRVLSFQDDFEHWPDKKYGERDVLSFLLHDFIHAEHFFSNAAKHRSQIGFYKCIHKILSENLLAEHLLIARFNNQFSYLISDMNSHVIHLLKTFKAILDQENLDPFIWKKICVCISELTTQSDKSQIILSLSKINSALFSHKDATELTELIETL